jgi:glutamate synthase domain-containing protein 2
MKLFLKLLDPMVDYYVKEMFSKEYGDNPYIIVTAAQKLGVKNIIEAAIRAKTGNILARPYGSNLQLSPWDKLLLSPRQLFMLPTVSTKEISTQVIIGKNSKKPLVLSMPIMITGMSYGGSLSLDMKIALAKASKIVGTSTNTGESTITKEVRKHSKYVVGQLNRGGRMKDEDLPYLDAIEIQLGQGAWGGAVESTTYAKDIDERLRHDWRLKKGEDCYFSARMDGINGKEDLINLVNELKGKYNVPIGIKIAASNFVEKELDVITSTACDYIVIDGCEGGTAVAPPTLEDNMGLPTLYALIRTVKYLKERNIKEKFDLIIAGGLSNPGHFLKAMALGADAVYIGSIALFAAIHNQAVKALPESPPTQLALNTGKLKDELDINEAAKSLSNFLYSCNEEIKLSLQAMGKKKLSELSYEDLISLDKQISEYTNIDYVLK